MRRGTLAIVGSLVFLVGCTNNLGASLLEGENDLPTAELFYYVGDDSSDRSDGTMVGIQTSAGSFTVCAMRFVSTTAPIPGRTSPLEESVEALIGRTEETYAPSDMPSGVRSLHNAVARFDSLTVDSIEFQGNDAIVALQDDGRGHEPCDEALLARQIELTAKQTPDVRFVTITLNGRTIKADTQ